MAGERIRFDIQRQAYNENRNPAPKGRFISENKELTKSENQNLTKAELEEKLADQSRTFRLLSASRERKLSTPELTELEELQNKWVDKDIN